MTTQTLVKSESQVKASPYQAEVELKYLSLRAELECMLQELQAKTAEK
jgi:hypothetical protein